MSASVTQVPSSWTRALTDGPAPPLTCGRAAGLPTASGRVTTVGTRCEAGFRRAEVAIATDILRHRRHAVHPSEANCAYARRDAGVDGARGRRRAGVEGDPRNRPEDAWLQSVDGRGR